jgi:hypothetical protein
MKHPFDAIHAKSQRRLLIWLAVGSLAVMILLSLVNRPLVTSAAPQGIISFELAGSSGRATQILESWDERARLSAAFGLGFDYVFMLAYSTTLSLACLMAAGSLHANHPSFSSFGPYLAWAQWMAAIFDALENIALLLLLLSPPADPWPQTAQVCATLKFLLIFLGMVYAFLGLAVHRMPDKGASR